MVLPVPSYETRQRDARLRNGMRRQKIIHGRLERSALIVRSVAGVYHVPIRAAGAASIHE